MQRSFCLYIQCTAHAVPPWYIRQRGVFVSQFISAKAFGDAQVYDERDKSLRFSCIYNQAQIIYADFGRLVGTKTFSDDEVVLSFG